MTYIDSVLHGQLLRAERKPWTNLTGAEPLVAREDLPPPKGYRWADSEWKLDVTGPWMDSILSIGKQLYTVYLSDLYVTD